MDNKNNDYTIAEVSSDDISLISALEKSLSTQKNAEIVLIAYQHSELASKQVHLS